MQMSWSELASVPVHWQNRLTMTALDAFRPRRPISFCFYVFGSASPMRGFRKKRNTPVPCTGCWISRVDGVRELDHVFRRRRRTKNSRQNHVHTTSIIDNPPPTGTGTPILQHRYCTNVVLILRVFDSCVIAEAQNPRKQIEAAAKRAETLSHLS
jgi:hypothetical protein